MLAENDYARKRLFGKRVKNGYIAKLVAKDILNGESITEICERLGFSDRKSIYSYRQLAIELRFLEITDNGDVIKPKIIRAQYQDENFDKFCENHLVAAWSKDMQQRKAGKPIRSWKNLLSTLYRISSNLKITPEQFLIGVDQKEVLQNGREIMQNFKAEFEAGNIPSSRKNADISHVMYSTSKALRDFMNYHGFPYPRGEKGVMSQSVNSFKGKYAHIKVSADQISHARQYIKAKWGLDSDIFRAFFFGLESCSRKQALINAKTDYETLQKNGKIAYVMKVFESKTQEIKGGIWTKYIMDGDTQESIDLARKRGPYLIEARTDRDIDHLQEKLREVYKEIMVNNLEYVLSHSFHCLRHFGAHYHLSRCNYNYAIVARCGGWNTTEEVEKSYGEMPAEVLLEVLFK